MSIRGYACIFSVCCGCVYVYAWGIVNRVYLGIK